jgi:DNA-binding response OmpR family regulator
MTTAERAAAATSRILVVDDDRRLCGFLARFLAGEGYAIAAAHDGRAMRRAVADLAFDLVILDLAFPSGEDGMSLARGLRAQHHDVPLIVLSGKSATIDKVVCLELGADDYVTKPFEPRELLARIRSLLRRAAGVAQPRWGEPGAVRAGGGGGGGGGNAVRFAGWRLDLGRRELVSPANRVVRLTSGEFQLLAALACRPGRTLSRDQILDLIANRHWAPCDRSVDVLIGKLRRKIGDDARAATGLIKTVRGVGYVFAPPAA